MYYVAEDDLEPLILLPPAYEITDKHCHAPACKLLGTGFMALCTLGKLLPSELHLQPAPWFLIIPVVYSVGAMPLN